MIFSKRIIKKYSYLRALLYGIPMGISFMIGGIVSYYNTPQNIDELSSYQGEIVDFGNKRYYDKKNDATYDVLFIEFENKREFYSLYHKHTDLLKKTLTKSSIGSDVKIWYKPDRKYIKQMTINGKELFKYTPPYWIAYTLFGFGALSLVFALAYVIKEPEHLTGKKKEKPKEVGK